MIEFNAYIDLVNLIDKTALADKKANTEEITRIKGLAEKAEINLYDFADANNCGEVNSWEDVVEDFRKQFKNGDRVSVLE